MLVVALEVLGAIFLKSTWLICSIASLMSLSVCDLGRVIDLLTACEECKWNVLLPAALD